MDRSINQNVRHFLVHGDDNGRVIDRLVGVIGGAPTADEPKNYSRTYLESFDWRLFQAGLKLVLETEKNGRGRLRLTELDEAAAGGISCAVKKGPLFAVDLPSENLRQKLGPLLEMRSLCLTATVQVKEWSSAVLDDMGKTVVRVRVEENQYFRDGEKTGIPLGARVSLEGVRGYDEEFSKVLGLLTKAEAFVPCEGGQMEQAFELMGRRPLDYSSKGTLKLDPETGAWEACREILLDQLDHVERNVDGTIKDLDSEFLHDLRVAVRRSRSLINRMKEIFPEEVLGRFSEDLAWVGTITGPTRDMDVYLLDYPKYRDSLDESMRGNLGPMHDYLIAHQKKEQKALARQLRTQRFKNFMTDWHRYLSTKQAPYGLPAEANQKIREVANQRIWKTFRRVVREGEAIADETPAEALHDLRKTCKKLRYLLEFFTSLYMEDDVKALIKALKGLQDNLGVFQDLDVQAEALKKIGGDMMVEGDRHPETFMSMGVLIDGFMRRKKEVRTEFYDRFAAFATQENKDKFSTLCGMQEKLIDGKGGRK